MSDARYTPELGQAVFGQPYQEFEVPDIWDAALCAIREELDRVMWNIHQRPYESPFSNTGSRFECPTFTVEAYSWDEDTEQPWNFKWGEVEISWYKYLGRGMSANKPLSPDLAATMLDECLKACRAYETEAGGLD